MSKVFDLLDLFISADRLILSSIEQLHFSCKMLVFMLTLRYTGGGHNDHPLATLKLHSSNRKVWFGPIFL